MRTSLNEINLLEAYLCNKLTVEEKLLLDARLIVDESLRDQLFWQKQSYQLVKEYGRRKLQEQLKVVEQDFFDNPQNKTLIRRIKSYFNR